MSQLLAGKHGLVVGIANVDSIAWGCTKAFRNHGAELAITYLNDKAKPYVEPLAEEVSAPIFLPLDVTESGQQLALFETIANTWADWISCYIRLPSHLRPIYRGGSRILRERVS
jgi:enoyl-[acyl-carrier protein] reductase I